MTLDLERIGLAHELIEGSLDAAVSYLDDALHAARFTAEQVGDGRFLAIEEARRLLLPYVKSES